MRNSPPTDLTGLTALRGLAAWWVVFYHFAPFLYTHLPLNIWLVAKKGFLAVDLFFILSGFVIFYSYQHSLSANVQSLRTFFVKRLARVYPLHFFFLGAYLILTVMLLIFRNTPPDPLTFSPTQFGLQLTLLQAWGFAENAGLSWNYPAWSVSAEFFAYLLFPIFLLVLKPQKWPTALLIGAILACTAGLIGYYFAIGICPGSVATNAVSVTTIPDICSLNRKIDATALFRCASQFFIGVCLCVLYFRATGWREFIGTLSCIAGVILLITGIALHWDDVYFATIGWTLLVFGVACEPIMVRKVLCHRSLIWLGNISYATYMCHALARVIFKMLFVSATNNPAVPFYAPLWSIIFTFVGILVVSHFLYNLFERPAQRAVLSRLLPKRIGAHS
jgi:peptidoglycan/LPS O-acetylase OafA/YrhL